MKNFLITGTIFVGIFFSYLIMKEVFDNRPFKFEKYKSYEELNEGLKRKFPVSSDMREVISTLEK